MDHPYDCFNYPGLPGALLFTPCPGTRSVPLADALDTLKRTGADGVITLMPADELGQNDVSDTADRCADRGLEWFHLPVADEQAPAEDFDDAWRSFWPGIRAVLDRGGVLAIHCKGGGGRTGLIAARIVMARGISVYSAVRAVQSLRPKAIKHPVHVSWLAAQGP